MASMFSTRRFNRNFDDDNDDGDSDGDDEDDDNNDADPTNSLMVSISNMLTGNATVISFHVNDDESVSVPESP